MPFGIRFKKTRRYDISTKNVFMVEVQMLDNSFLECTLTSESTGHECLEGIAQKIELAEIQYFGLRYVTKKLQFRWVDLDKPLKKQLEKYAQASHSTRSPRLYFGVMFYIANAHKIVDDVARYQYYLQLKNDIVDGRLPLTVDQVIRLAAFSLQVEFSDHEYDRTISDYFTDNMVFPKNLTKDDNIMSELMNEVLQVYISLQGVHPVKAEIQYMKEIQMMDGYGMEYYVAKDERAKELYIGTSYVGIFARYLDGQPPTFFKWTEVARLSQSKKTFEIDTSKSSVQYTMEDSDTAKYLKRMCLLQQKFYKSNKTTLSASLSDVTEFPEHEMIPDIQQSVLPQLDIPPDQLNQSQTSLSSLKYGDQKYEPDSHSASVNTDDYYTRSQQSLNVSEQNVSTSSQQYLPSMHQDTVTHHPVVQQSQQPQIIKTPYQDPTLDPNYASRLAALPAYRHTPDYETVMRQRMSQMQPQMHAPQQIHDVNQSLAHSHIYATPEEGLAYSQPEIGHSIPAYSPENNYQMGAQVRPYANSVSMYTNIFQENNDYMQYRMGDRQTNLVMQPTYSSPELNTHTVPPEFHQDHYLTVNETFAMHYKPPPPYPRGSNSTPDLAVQTINSNVSNSPDLISRKTLGDSAFINQSSSSVENSAQAIPEVVTISEEPERLHEVSVDVQTSQNAQDTQNEQDDAASDHSNTTFLVKETDSETEETFVRSVPQRQSSKSKVLVRFVDPNKAPPPSTSKDVATRRESFRRMMIARSGSFTPGVLKEQPSRFVNINRSLREKEKNSIEEHIQEVNKSSPTIPPRKVTENVENKQPEIKQKTDSESHKSANKSVISQNSNVISHSSSASENFDISRVVPAPGREVIRSQSDVNKQTNNKVEIKHEKSVSVDSSKERQQLLEKLKSAEMDMPDTIVEHDRLSGSMDNLVVEDSDSETEKDEKSKGPIGPLKLAAMNGLSMSRPMVLALMNDETRAPKDERRKILEAKLSQNLVFKEFEETPKKVTELDCNVSKLPDNSPRNRFRDVLPYDGTRVKLTPRKDNSSGYINASHIKFSVGNRIWWYIATQAPLDNTAVDFWQMIWEQEVEVIGMLTALVELGRPKCYSYWPQDPGVENKLVFGDFEVTLLFTNDSLCYITNQILLRHLPSKKERQVWHLQYTDWPDHGCPDDMYGFLGFVDEIESIQRLAESEEGSGKKSPIVIHCSAGVGRTGVVILTQVMKWCLEHNQEIDLPKALNLIRHQRMFMVQTLGQYNFIHKTLIQYLKNTRLI